jgi:hypothetical protein
MVGAVVFHGFVVCVVAKMHHVLCITQVFGLARREVFSSFETSSAGTGFSIFETLAFRPKSRSRA